MVFADLMPLFAQANRNFGPGGGGGAPAAGPGPAEAGMMAVFMIAYFAFLAVMIGISIMFMLSMSRALRACSPRNRTMEPGQVWLSFIPLVGIVFYVMAILKIPESFANEYRSRGIRGDGDYGKNLGLWFVITSFVCPGVNLVLWVMYWIKINEHTKDLNSRGSERYDDDDEDDDRPRRSRRSGDNAPRTPRRRDDDNDDDR